MRVLIGIGRFDFPPIDILLFCHSTVADILLYRLFE